MKVNCNNKAGISLLTLIITIIVIIILAAIVIFSGLNTPDRANLSKFVSEFSDFHTAVTQDYMERYKDYAISGKTRSDKAIYYAIAQNTDWDNVDANPPATGKVENLNKNNGTGGLGPVMPDEITGEDFYEITDDTSVKEWKQNIGYYEKRATGANVGEHHYVTDTGEVFILPGYRVLEGNESRWYINERKYYTTDNPLRLTAEGIIPSSGIALNNKNLALQYSPSNPEIASLQVTKENVNGTVEWTSSDTSVATVSSDGTVTAAGKGTAVITAKVGTYTDTCNVNVLEKAKLYAIVTTTGGNTERIAYVSDESLADVEDKYSGSTVTEINYTSSYDLSMSESFKRDEVDRIIYDGEIVLNSDIFPFNLCDSVHPIKSLEFKGHCILPYNSITLDVYFNYFSDTFIDLRGLDTTKMEYMDDFFHYCTEVKKIIFGGYFTTKNVKRIVYYGSGLFEGMYNLTEIEGLDTFDTAKITDMSKMFSGCSNLRSVDLSSFDTINVTNMSEMFTNSGIEEIFVGENWNTDSVTNSNEMFEYCSSLCGGSGTYFDDSHTDKEYARIDNPPDEPGYFTRKQ